MRGMESCKAWKNPTGIETIAGSGYQREVWSCKAWKNPTGIETVNFYKLSFIINWVARPEKTRQGLKHSGIAIQEVILLSCKAWKNPTGIETIASAAASRSR